MRRNYFKRAWHSLLVNRLVSLINIAGIAIAIGCCTLMYLGKENTLRYNHTSRLMHNVQTEEPVKPVAQPLTGPLVKGNFPGVLKMVRIGLPIEKLLGYKDRKIPGSNKVLPDSDFFYVPSLPVIRDYKAIPAVPRKITYTESIALGITFFNVTDCLQAVQTAITSPINFITNQDV